MDVLLISVGDRNPTLVELCHFPTAPVCPDNVKFAGVVPEQIV